MNQKTLPTAPDAGTGFAYSVNGNGLRCAENRLLIGPIPEMTSNTGHPLVARHVVRRLLLDPWIAAAVLTSGVFLAIPGIHRLSAITRSDITDYYSTIVLLALTIGAVLYGTRRLESRREKYFWRLIGLSIAAWLAGETMAYFFLHADNPAAGTAVDALYLCFYLGFVLALDIQPQSADDHLRIRPLRVLASAGRTLFVSGLFVYFVLLPRTLGVDEYLTWIPSFSFYVILDLYLVVRLSQESGLARTRRWRSVYTLLAAAAAFVLATDSMDFAWIMSILPETLPRVSDILWYAPMILIVVACRLANLTASSGVQSGTDDDRVRGVSLLVYSLAFALVHLTLTLIQHQTGLLQDARIVLVMLWLVLFGGLNLVQNAIIERHGLLQTIRRKEAEDHIRSLSRQDSLTRLLNRRALDEEFNRAVARAGRSGLMLGLMFIDLDDFKIVNDKYGHRAGDEVLREVAARIQTLTREVDTLARYGGDEFILIFEALEDRATMEVVGQRVLDGFKMGFQFESGRIELSASIGIAVFPEHGRTTSELFEAADRAMYTIKQSSGSGIAFA